MMEQKEDKKEKEKDEKEEKKEEKKFLRAGGPTKGSTRGPRGPKKKRTCKCLVDCSSFSDPGCRSQNP